MTALTKKEMALSHTSGEILSSYDYGSCYEGYLEIKRALKYHEEPNGVNIWQPFENLSWEEIVQLIEGTANI